MDITVVEFKGCGVEDDKVLKTYVLVSTSFSNQQMKTKTAKGKQSIDQTCNLLLPKSGLNDDTASVYVKVFKKKSWPHQDSLLGEAALKVRDMKSGERWEKLVDSKGKEVGQVLINVKCSGTNGEDDEKGTFESQYTRGEELGRGSFSIVYKGTRKSDGKVIAVKVVNKVGQGADVIKLLRREISVMKKLQHPNIVSLLDVFEDDKTITMVIEYVPGGELYDQIIDRGSFSESDTISVVRQLLNALAYMHAHGVAHRDLKPENLLCETDGNTVKIADFGLSKDFSTASVMQTCCGSPSYVAPEVLAGGVYDTACDIWSLGVITYVILSGFLPFFADTQQELFDKIMEGEFEFNQPVWEDVSDDAKNFITECLTLEPEDRPDAATLLKHPWIVNSMERKHQLNATASMADLRSGFNPKTRGRE